MGADLEELEEADSAPPPPGTNKVEITVAGHTVVVESTEPLEDVVGWAMGIFEQTADAARRSPLGFDVGVAHVERAEPYREPSPLESWEADDARRLDRHKRHAAPLATTRRLVLGDTPGGHRTRLWPVPVDREQRPLP
jgi:hypothetical protein